MRNDALGFFWEDRPVVKEAKPPPPKRTPPERTWEDPNYLPGLGEAQRFDVKLFTDEELFAARGSKLVFDIECYPNYFLISFMCPTTERVVFFEKWIEHTPEGEPYETVMDVRKLEWVLHSFTQVGFNSMGYDVPMSALAVAGKTCAELQGATFELIVNETQSYHVLRSMKTKALKIDHIDLIEVAPGFASLKIYGGRMHAPRMQDLPFPPQTWLSKEQIDIVRWYNINDLRTTALLLKKLEEPLALRQSLSNEFGRDLRSKSDAQIAEQVIAAEMERSTGVRPHQPTIAPGTVYRYRVPHFVSYETPRMQWCLDVVRNADFVVSEEGNVGMPAALADLQIQLGEGVYTMGIGGLHSTEKTVAHRAEGCRLLDRDVESYYPRIILNLGLYPPHLGPTFLTIYNSIVERRLHAKRTGNKVVADSLKITINGSFGKLGSPYSVLYGPDLLVQTTLTGQLSLLMLIECFELRGIPVVSANTDGIVIKCPLGREADYEAIVAWWEQKTAFKTEETEYRALYSKDVNNYIAVKTDGKTKKKGIYADTGLQKNATANICMQAVEALLTTGTPIQDTVRACKDIRQFVAIRKVKGGAVKEGEYLGVSIRWYYATGMTGEIVYASSGNKVPKSDGAKPCMDLPTSFPDDVDFDWYIKECEKILCAIGYT